MIQKLDAITKTDCIFEIGIKKYIDLVKGTDPFWGHDILFMDRF